MEESKKYRQLEDFHTLVVTEIECQLERILTHTCTSIIETSITMDKASYPHLKKILYGIYFLYNCLDKEG